jgi:hypothetical protein
LTPCRGGAWLPSTPRRRPPSRLDGGRLSSVTANAATGVYYQFANRVVREDVMAGNTDFWMLSDGAEIPVSSSTHFNLGLNYDLPSYLF